MSKSITTLKIEISQKELSSSLHFIEPQFIKLLFIICKKTTTEINPWNKEIFAIKIEFDPNCFSQEECLRAIQQIPPSELTEQAALGLAFCFIKKHYNDISELECYDATGEGYDYRYRTGDRFYRIEISGVNSGDKDTFTSRISDKRVKFNDVKYHDEGFSREDIFIVDFHFKKYTYWDTKTGKNYKRE